MHRMGWVLWLWPGLPQVCRSGSWAGLSVAVGLTILLNVAILATFGWSELVGPGMRNALWIAFGAAWLAAAVLSVGAGQAHCEDPQFGPVADNFSEAVEYYLKGNWFETQRTLEQRLARAPQDADARLMLASLLRHTQRWEEPGASSTG